MIRVAELTRRYGSFVAVDRVTFTISPGEIVGFLGPNGAGKSTLLKMLATYLPPSSGRIEVAGVDVGRDPAEVRRKIGYLAEHNPLFDGMRVARFLEFIARVRGLERRHAHERIAWAADRCGLSSVLAKPILACSKGTRQRVGLAAAILHDPPVLLLDEPTHGLDPLQVVAFRQFLRELAPGRAVLFSSHVLAEVLESSDRVLLIHQGSILLDEAVAALRERSARERCSEEDLILRAVRTSPTRVTLEARP